MNWEQTIQYIRTKPEYLELVEKAYFEEDLSLNVERFRQSEEFRETQSLLKQYAPKAKRLLDIGSGNGISAVSFALEGYEVVSVEPDPSTTIGAGAIKLLKAQYGLNQLEVYESFAEDIQFPDVSFDVVYSRQCMHHAYDLQKFVNEAYRVLLAGGIFFTVRDHVIYDEKDKALFLEAHPLHKYYGGENAFTRDEYQNAIKNAGFHLEKVLSHFESPINYFPLSTEEKKRKEKEHHALIQSIVKGKLKFLSGIGFINEMAARYVSAKLIPPFDEQSIPGRLYSFISKK